MTFYEHLSRFLSDPLRRHEILDKHESILQEMQETKERSEHVRNQTRFPLSAQVGNPRLRRREQNYARNN